MAPMSHHNIFMEKQMMPLMRGHKLSSQVKPTLNLRYHYGYGFLLVYTLLEGESNRQDRTMDYAYQGNN